MGRRRRPLCRTIDNKVLKKNAGQCAVCHSLAGIAGRDEHAFAIRVQSDEAAIVDGVHHLTGPPRDLSSECRH
jgi:hypothetical protein